MWRQGVFEKLCGITLVSMETELFGKVVFSLVLFGDGAFKNDAVSVVSTKSVFEMLHV